MIITPELMVKEILASIAFYQSLGFSVSAQFPENRPTFAVVKNDTAQLMLYQEADYRDEFPHLTNPIGGTVALFINVDDISDFYERLKTNVVKKLHQTDYGTHEFAVLDPDGYTLIFSQEIK